MQKPDDFLRPSTIHDNRTHKEDRGRGKRGSVSRRVDCQPRVWWWASVRPVCAANNDKRGISILVGSRRAELLRLQQHSLRKENSIGFELRCR